jgi:hypothetical protein
VFGDQRAVVMRPLAEDDRVALLAILKTGAAEVPFSCPIMWFSLTSCGAGDGPSGYTISLRFFVPIA